MIMPCRLETPITQLRGTGSLLEPHRFPPDVIMLAARWYLRYGLSYRDVEELLASEASRSTT